MSSIVYTVVQLARGVVGPNEKETDVFGQILAFMAVLLIGLAAVAILWFLGMRTKFPPTMKAMIWFTRTVMNPSQMKSAGTPGAYASVIRCCGRKSGRPYETPVVPVPTDDGFAIALPYGSRANWLKNVLANGSATILHQGSAFAVDRPEIVPMRAVEAFFSVSDRRSHRLFGVDECLRVRTVAEPAATGASATAG
jgi:deazaflavin-dependent oxidoreductase (nitroreductase family)